MNGKKFNQFGGWDQGKRDMLEVLKEINHHGVSVAEIERGKDGRWTYKANSAYNRRINGQTRMRINYGLNRVRFTSVVPVGSRLRARMTLKAAEWIEQGGLQMTWSVTVEREGHDKPVCVAESLSRRYP